MRFTPRSEAEAFFKKLGIGPNGPIAGTRAADRFKSSEFYYRSRLVNADRVASALSDAQGEFLECVVWPFDLVFGDRSTDEEFIPDDWRDYKRWREGHGETRRLYDAPGHVFQSDERSDLARLIELAIYMGWDALIGARPTKVLIMLSHDDVVTLYARSRPTDLFSELVKLGLRKAPT